MDTIHDLRSGSPESLAARAFAGFWQVVKTGRKTALTTGLTTDRKNFDFRPQRGIIAKTEYPGVVQLIERAVWDREAESLSLSTRTNAPRSDAPGGVFFVYCGAGFEGPCIGVVVCCGNESSYTKVFVT